MRYYVLVVLMEECNQCYCSNLGNDMVLNELIVQFEQGFIY